MSMTLWAELWSDLECNDGRALGDFRLADAGSTWSEQVDASDGCDVAVLYDSRVQASLQQVIRLTSSDGRVWEYRINAIERTTANDVRRVIGVSPLHDLATAGSLFAYVGARPYYALAANTDAEAFLDDVVLTRLTEDGVSYFQKGTVDATGTALLAAPDSGWTRGEWLVAIGDAFGLERRARRVGSTHYAVDLVERIGALATPVYVAKGRNLIDQIGVQDDTELATAMSVLGPTPSGDTVPAGIGENAWTLGTIPGSPFWIPLTDPAGGAGPIAFDDQCVGMYLLRTDGGTTEITDSRASDSAVLVAATTGLVAGEPVQLVLDTDANRIAELSVPNAKRLHRKEVLKMGGAGRNLAINGLLSEWSAPDSLDNWTAEGGTFLYGRYTRTEPQQLTGVVCDGLQSNGATTIAFRGAQPFARFYEDEQVIIGTATEVVTGGVHEAASDGTGTFTCTALSGNQADGVSITLRTGLNTIPVRPLSASWPVDGAGLDAVKFIHDDLDPTPPSPTQARLQSAPVTIKYHAGVLSQVNCGAGFTCHNGGPSFALGNRDGSSVITDDPDAVVTRYLPAIMLRNHDTNALLAYSFAAQSIPALSTVNETCVASLSITSDTEVDVCMLAGDSDRIFQACRWVALWLGAAETFAPVNGSHDNVRWQRANRALLSRQIGSTQMRLTIADLSQLVGYSVARESLVLGGDIVLEDEGVTLRLIGLVFSATLPHLPELLIDARPSRLTRFLAERV